MTVEVFRAEGFRCLEPLELVLEESYNLIDGANASGKTSLLEALAYLGRGKSFRGAPVSSVVRHGESEFTLFAAVKGARGVSRLGLRNGREGLEIRYNGDTQRSTAILAETLPVQVIDPEVHDLVGGGPELRRRYLDGIAFHVEHGFLEDWRRFKRALKQRNAALKAGGAGLDAWTAEFVERGLAVDRARRAILDVCHDSLLEQGGMLLECEVGFEYRQGWVQDQTLADAVGNSVERDLQAGSTQLGPHRADIKLIYDERQARRLVSRGQQKLLACSMVLAATEVIQTHREQPILLLLDDPAAELDRNALGRLMQQVSLLGSQVVATALDASTVPFPGSCARFHVEHGRLSIVN